ncbi:MAG: hypothetical protein WEC16_01365 [Anaerolineales bacterium]
MGRVISTVNLATERNRLLKAMALAMREMSKKSSYDDGARDLAAFLILALDAVAESVERSVLPWEKRGYWVKADRFRMDWAWAESMRMKIRAAVDTDRPDEVALAAVVLADKLKNIKVAEKHRMGSPWQGAWNQLKGK